jgi:hypothetical protein
LASQNGSAPAIASATGSANASTTAFPSNVQVTQSASGAFLSNLTNPSKTLSIIDASTISLSTASLTASATQGVVTGSPEGLSTYSAPHYVIYSDSEQIRRDLQEAMELLMISVAIANAVGPGSEGI